MGEAIGGAELGARVRAAIKRSGRTQVAVARDLGMVPSAFSRLLTEGRNLKMHHLQRIGAFCGIDLAELVGAPPRTAPAIWSLFMEMVRIGVPPVAAYDLATGRGALLSEEDRSRLNALGPRLRETFASGGAAPALSDLFPPAEPPSR